MAAAPNCDHELLLSREAKCRDDVAGAGRPDDERRPTVDHPVPDRARRVVAGVVGEHDLAAERLAEGAQAPHAGEPIDCRGRSVFLVGHVLAPCGGMALVVDLTIAM